MCGIPVGHTVCYKAGHNLHAKFARKLMEMYAAGGASKAVAYTRSLLSST
jgi:UDP-3-O-acyl-N-acetylglucosamine deacetylase